MDINLLRSAVTVAALVAFLGILVWAYLPSRREELEQAAALALKDEEPTS